MSLKYRDPKTGKLINKNSASKRNPENVVTERYTESKKENTKTDELPGYIPEDEDFTDEIDARMRTVFDPGFVDEVLESKPFLTSEQIIAVALKTGQAFDRGELDALILAFDLDIDPDNYL